MLTYLLAGMTILSAALGLALVGACGTIRRQRECIDMQAGTIQKMFDSFDNMQETYRTMSQTIDLKEANEHKAIQLSKDWELMFRSLGKQFAERN